MTNQEIINKYNSQADLLSKLMNTYENTYDSKFPACSHPLTLDESYLERNNDILMYMLYARENDIELCKKELDKYYNFNKNCGSDDIKEYIKGLNKRKKEILVEIQEIRKETENSFRNLLNSIGLSAWVIDKYHTGGLTSNKLGLTLQFNKHFIKIYIHTVGNAKITSPETLDNVLWTLELMSMSPTFLNLDLRKPRDIENAKLYVTMYDHSYEIMNWLNTTYNSAVKKILNLYKEFKQVKKDLCDPFKTYMDKM